jgi:signal transduction histidine kinase
MQELAPANLRVCLWLTDAIAQTRSLGEIYDAALEALERGLGVSRAAILLFDPDGMMRFKASRGISERYRRAVEGHTPWSPDTPDPQPVLVSDVAHDPALEPFVPVFSAEGIAALAFFPLVSQRRVIGKFMLYYDAPHQLSETDQEFSRLVASQVAFAVERMQAAENAREASRLKDEFLAMLSHELRTPLNAIVGWLRLLQSGALDATHAAEAIAIIDRNAALQVQLIDQMLDVSRIVVGKLQIDRGPLLLTHLVEDAVKAIQPAAIAKRITLASDLPSSLPPIEGDAERLQQILSNLLSNAVKFTPAGGEVRVRCLASEGLVQVEVQDNGIGITADFLPLVFERFRQADTSTTRPHGGLGLGLAISRHLAELHGGAIQASSPGKGRGATFTLTLPVPRFVVPPRDVTLATLGSSRAAAALESA